MTYDAAAIHEWTQANQRARREYDRDPNAAANAFRQTDNATAARRMRRLRAKQKETDQ